MAAFFAAFVVTIGLGLVPVVVVVIHVFCCSFSSNGAPLLVHDVKTVFMASFVTVCQREVRDSRPTRASSP